MGSLKSLNMVHQPQENMCEENGLFSNYNRVLSDDQGSNELNFFPDPRN